MKEGICHCRLQIWTMISILISNNFFMVEPLAITVHEVECVYEYVLYEGDNVSGSFVVVDHNFFWPPNHPGIDFTVTSPTGDVILTVNGTSGKQFEFKSPRFGMYRFCFHNPHSLYSSPETVSFYVHIGHIPKEQNIVKNEHMNHYNRNIAMLKEALEYVIGEQKYLKARETRRHHISESTRKRVIFYTVAECVLLGLASTLQVVYIRRLFDHTIAYNRV